MKPEDPESWARHGRKGQVGRPILPEYEKTKNYTISVPPDIAILIEEQAALADMSSHKFLSQLIQIELSRYQKTGSEVFPSYGHLPDKPWRERWEEITGTKIPRRRK